MARSSERDTDAVRGFLPPQNDEERMLMRHAEDLARTAMQREIPRYSAFLSDREQLLAEAAMHRAGCNCWHWEGGWPGAERKVLCVEPETTAPALPIACLCIKCKMAPGAEPPRHQDYLGSLLGLELKREAVGDIVPDVSGAGSAWIFTLKSAARVILSDLCKVGNMSVSVEEKELAQVPAFSGTERETLTATVSSLRLDSVLAAMLHCSRGMAGELIAAGRVEVNHVAMSSAHAPVYNMDVFTVRGKGRYQITELPGKSKKDRYIIAYIKY